MREHRHLVAELDARIDAVAAHTELYEEGSFVARTDAIDALEFDVVDRIESELHASPLSEELIRLQRRASSVKQRLEQVDHRLYRQLRDGILSGRISGAALGVLLDSLVPPGSPGRRRLHQPGYDHLDVLVNGMLGIAPLPDEEKPRLSEMVSFQQTPARIILALARRANLTTDDIFYDLGSGLGQVPILIHLLSGAAARGVEFEPAYYRCSAERSADLRLQGVTFVNADARAADFSDGTVFFMYTPFVGAMLRDVSDALLDLYCRKPIRLFTYGPCSSLLCQDRWGVVDDQLPSEFALVELRARPGGETWVERVALG